MTDASNITWTPVEGNHFTAYAWINGTYHETQWDKTKHAFVLKPKGQGSR